MNEPAPLQIVTTTVRTVDEKTVWAKLSEEKRRQILRALFDGQLRRAPNIGGTGSLERDLIRKHMATLVKAGLVVAESDPQNRRCQLYKLSPAVKTITTPEGRTMDFGYCTMRC